MGPIEKNQDTSVKRCFRQQKARVNMRPVPSLITALLLLATPALLLGTAVGSATLQLSQAPAPAQSTESVAKVAQAITVKAPPSITG